MVRSRSGKITNKFSSKEQIYATGSLSSMRRTQRLSAKENTPIATSEKREKTKKAKKSQQESAGECDFYNKIIVVMLCL